MAKKYYLHRISHEGNVSYSLIKKRLSDFGMVNIC